ncbi:MAG: MlaC/ttg2D family ABC transporter substrate-binding protein [Candidatus Eutrophobiaceae bacterium]
MPVCSAPVWAVDAEDADAPMTYVEHIVGKVLGTMTDQSLTLDQRREKVIPLLRNSFEFNVMVRSVLSAYWKQASVDMQQRFTELFSNYVLEVFYNRLLEFRNEQVHFIDETLKGEWRAEVHTQIALTHVLSGKNMLPIKYRLRKNKENQQWYAYDMVIEGISLLGYYRESFAGILRKEGVEGVIADLELKLQKLQASR